MSYMYVHYRQCGCGHIVEFVWHTRTDSLATNVLTTPQLDLTRELMSVSLQVCSAGSRLIVQENVAEQMVTKIKERLTHFRVGDSLDKVRIALSLSLYFKATSWICISARC